MNFANAIIGRTHQQVQDLLSSAFYGGIGYWAIIEGYVSNGEVVHVPTSPSVFVTKPGHALQIAVPERANNNPDEWKFKGKKDGDVQLVLLTPEKLQKGIQIMAENYPRHFGDWCNDNSDSITGDVFVQCSLFGEIVFG